MNSISEAILITGASGRLGLAFARKCVSLGYKIILHYRTMHDELEMLLNTEQHLKNNIFLVQQDLKHNPENLIDSALSFPIKITGLINNASIFSEGNLIDFNHFEEMLTINALMPIRLSNAFFQKIKKGWIINITDAMCDHSNTRFQNYRLSKHILELFTKQQSLLFAPDIRVNAIAPGAMIPSPDEKDYYSKLNAKIPLKKTGDIDSLLNTLSFLINTPYITGEIIKIDGGWNLLD